MPGSARSGRGPAGAYNAHVESDRRTNIRAPNSRAVAPLTSALLVGNCTRLGFLGAASDATAQLTWQCNGPGAPTSYVWKRLAAARRNRGQCNVARSCDPSRSVGPGRGRRCWPEVAAGHPDGPWSNLRRPPETCSAPTIGRTAAGRPLGWRDFVHTALDPGTSPVRVLLRPPTFRRLPLHGAWPQQERRDRFGAHTTFHSLVREVGLAGVGEGRTGRCDVAG